MTWGRLASRIHARSLGIPSPGPWNSGLRPPSFLIPSGSFPGFLGPHVSSRRPPQAQNLCTSSQDSSHNLSRVSPSPSLRTCPPLTHTPRASPSSPQPESMTPPICTSLAFTSPETPHLGSCLLDLAYTLILSKETKIRALDSFLLTPQKPMPRLLNGKIPNRIQTHRSACSLGTPPVQVLH